MKNLVPEGLRRKWKDRTIDRKKYSCSTFMLYLGVDGEVDLPHHTIYTSRGYRGNLDDIRDGRLTDDASTYVHNPSRLDPTLAPAGHSSLYVLVPTPNNQADIDWSTEGARYREETLDRLETVFGIAGVRDRIRAERVVTPADWQAENINVGATFNLAHGLDQMLHRRPQHRLEDVDGVWTVGGGTHPGSGLPVIFLSSQITADLLCKEVGVTPPTAWTPTATPRTARTGISTYHWRRGPDLRLYLRIPELLSLQSPRSDGPSTTNTCSSSSTRSTNSGSSSSSTRPSSSSGCSTGTTRSPRKRRSEGC